ncbi:MAG: aldehyde dehydrogenase [Lawsonibacter sp.]|nr:aldehyde dehydrogenase [Lawsonibacter sp.]
MSVSSLLSAQRGYFRSGATLPLPARKRALRALLRQVTLQEGALLAALREDLGKARFEGYMTEVGLVKDELRFHLKHLDRWAAGRRVPTPPAQFPGRSRIRPEPLGAVLIMAPWNYPVQLSLEPLIGALSAGNCAVLKPSAYAPASSRALAKLISGALPPELAAVAEGGREENQALLEQKFDYIFFTGSVSVGRYVMEKAARHLTPVTLELGGKSPCIVTPSAHLRTAARRIAFGKLLNAGQTCVAPDYLLVHESVKDRLIPLLEEAFAEFLGPNPLSNPDYPRIVNQKHLERLTGLLEGERVLFGGQTEGLRIAPTLLDCADGDAPVMQEEIFGPILPLLTYRSLEQALDFIRDRPRPLALYLFTQNKKEEEAVFSGASFGGGCVNDTVVHLATPHMPFGGVGESGMGACHGKASFDTFSHYKSVLKKSALPDPPVRYHPYTPGKEKLLRLFLR